MRFKCENLLYELSFDGTILKYTRKPLLRLILLNPFGTKQLEFCAKEISKCDNSSILNMLNSYRLELAQWNPASDKMQYRKLPGIYLLGMDRLHTSVLSRIIHHETRLDKKKQTWFIPRDYGRMVS